MNAQERTQKDMEETYRRRAFEYAAEAFVRRWGPDDRDDAARFTAELFSLVRQIHIDAAEPFAEQFRAVLTNSLSLTSLVPIVRKPEP